MSRDSIGNVLRVSVLLCLVCAIAVSAAAVGLGDRQAENKRLDQQKNVLLATGNYDPAELPPAKVKAEFDKVEIRYIDLQTGEAVDAAALPNGVDYDPRAAAGNPKLSVAVSADESAKLGLKNLAPYYPVYRVKKNGKLDCVVLPIVGKGLWSTMYGFLALEPDLKTVRGINYYEHGETPGLGGEVDNPLWKAEWKGKVAVEDGKPDIKVVKGGAKGDDEIDSLAGATITSRGVQNTVNYWLGDAGFGKYLERARDKGPGSMGKS